MLPADGIKGIFDTYGRQARLFPGLLTVFPTLLALVAWFPALLTSSIGGTLLTLAMSCGLLYALGSWARTRGKRVEASLLSEWGGWPTTLLLRHSSKLDRVTRARYHGFLGAQVPGLVMPSEAEEAQAREQADEVYASAVKWLKERTRASNFAMIDRENAQYGFRRNLLGLRPIGLWSCAITFLGSVAVIALNTDGLYNALKSVDWGTLTLLAGSMSSSVWAALAVNLIAFVAWLRVVNKPWVREAADQYAEALLAACDLLAQSAPVKSKRGEPRIRPTSD